VQSTHLVLSLFNIDIHAKKPSLFSFALTKQSSTQYYYVLQSSVLHMHLYTIPTCPYSYIFQLYFKGALKKLEFLNT
jgi:hypothetical protein